MAKPTMQQPTPSATANTSDDAYPSVIISDPYSLDDSGAYGTELRQKPDFVKDDDRGWVQSQ